MNVKTVERASIKTIVEQLRVLTVQLVDTATQLVQIAPTNASFALLESTKNVLAPRAARVVQIQVFRQSKVASVATCVQLIMFLALWWSSHALADSMSAPMAQSMTNVTKINSRRNRTIVIAPPTISEVLEERVSHALMVLTAALVRKCMPTE